MTAATPRDAEYHGPLRRSPDATHLGRRLFLGLVGAGALATVGAGTLNELLRTTTGVSLTTGGFRIYTVTNELPATTKALWRLEADGDLLPEPRTFDFASLTELGLVTETSDFHCVTGWSVYDCRWTGVPMSTFLDAVGAPTDTGYVMMHSFDGAYVESLDMDQARRPGNMIAVALNDEPISRAQGYPARTIVPAMYGYKGTKWLSRIEVSSRKTPGYWVIRGYDDDGWVGSSNGYGET